MTREIKVNGGSIPVNVEENNGVHVITIDGVVWVETDNYIHATVLFNMICDHITEYMHYERL